MKQHVVLPSSSLGGVLTSEATVQTTWYSGCWCSNRCRRYPGSPFSSSTSALARKHVHSALSLPAVRLCSQMVRPVVRVRAVLAGGHCLVSL